MKKWETVNKFKIQNSKFKVDELVEILLENRGIKTKKEIEEFLNPKLENVTAENVGINKKQLKQAVNRIRKAIKNKERIVVFGDYDVDGICGTAILWETLHKLGANVMPYIPHRIDEGYGLSVKGITNVILNLFQDLSKMPKPIRQAQGPEYIEGQVRHDNIGLIITVDNGIVASEAVDFAKKQGIDVIITDHHLPSKKLPKALAIVHSAKLCGAGVAWILANSIWHIANRQKTIRHTPYAIRHLELIALATIADLVPLLGFNRTLVKYGLEKLKKTKRIGVLELFEEAALDPSDIGVYEIGHIIAPRLNAMGRLEYAMDSLRLLCTKNKDRAKELAEILGRTNRERQELTEETANHAKSEVKNQASSRGSARGQSEVSKLLFISHESYQQGVIGLVAGKLVEEFYRPAIVVSKGKIYSKASARSIRGFNIIEFLRSASEFMIDVGGHPMAAGFTVETEKLSILQKRLEKMAQKLLDGEKLTRKLRIDCELSLQDIDEELYDAIQKLAPFGMGNPEPTFMSRDVIIADVRLVGKDGKHLKLRLQQSTINNQQSINFDAIAFGMGETKLHTGDCVDIAYTIEENVWNGNKNLQLKIKDIKN